MTNSRVIIVICHDKMTVIIELVLIFSLSPLSKTWKQRLGYMHLDTEVPPPVTHVLASVWHVPHRLIYLTHGARWWHCLGRLWKL